MSGYQLSVIVTFAVWFCLSSAKDETATKYV
jgi:hypothetical protein